MSNDTESNIVSIYVYTIYVYLEKKAFLETIQISVFCIKRYWR